jgi:NhaP-type Na+/H+ or K+/H+ antiporter
MTYKQRSLIALLLLPLVAGFGLKIISLSNHRETNQLLASELGTYLFFSLFNYFIVFTVGLPVLRQQLRKGRTSWRQFAVTGFGLAAASSFVVISLLTGFSPLYEFRSARLVVYCGLIGCVEAILYWVFVRPDKFEHGSEESRRTSATDSVT